MDVSALNPAEPVLDDGSYGGFQDIADHLDNLHPSQGPHYRQLVARWYAKRNWNGFPERIPVRYKDGKVRLHFNKALVEAWYVRFRETRRRVPPAVPTRSTGAAPSLHPADNEVNQHHGYGHTETTRKDGLHARPARGDGLAASREHPRERY